MNPYRNKILLILILLLLPVTLLSADKYPAGTPLFLWEIENDETPSYLCGSVHLMSREQFPLPQKIVTSFEESDMLVVEVDIMNDFDPNQDPSLAMGMYYEGKTLQDVLPEDVLAETEEVFEELGLPLVMFSAFKPWVLSTVIVQMRMEALGYSAELGLDLYFLREAYETGKSVEQLETAAEQLRMMSSLPEEIQITMLKESLESREEFKSELTGMFTAWETGNLNKMEEILEKNRTQSPESEYLREVLIFERNERMTASIAELLNKNKSCFIVVGAAHLIGPKNIRVLLEKNGYPARQLSRTNK